MKKIVLVTGGFDPLHSGHIEYFKEAKKLGDILVVGVNSDAWLTRKKGAPFMPLLERTNIVRNFKMVDFVIDFDDDDGVGRGPRQRRHGLDVLPGGLRARGGGLRAQIVHLPGLPPKGDVSDFLRLHSAEALRALFPADVTPWLDVANSQPP